jgi:uncharacterized protein (TIGR00369 family)
MEDYLNNPIVQGYIKSNHFGVLLDMDFEIIGPGEVAYSMTISKKHLATPVAAHGGSISALMDGTMGVAALSKVFLDGKVVSTVEMKISFVSPAFLDDVLTGSANILKSGKRILFAEGKIVNQKNQLVAAATATFNAYPAKKAGF